LPVCSAPVWAAVSTPREPGHHGQSRNRQVGREHFGHAPAVGGRIPPADDGHRAVGKHRRVAEDGHDRRRIVQQR